MNPNPTPPMLRGNTPRRVSLHDEDNVVIDNAVGFDVHARLHDKRYQAFVYLGMDIVMTYSEAPEDFPEGLYDFANHSMRRFARRLAEVMADTS